MKNSHYLQRIRMNLSFFSIDDGREILASTMICNDVEFAITADKYPIGVDQAGVIYGSSPSIFNLKASVIEFTDQTRKSPWEIDSDA